MIEKSATSKLICYQHPNEAHDPIISRFALKQNSNDFKSHLNISIAQTTLYPNTQCISFP